ncbi:hypothetical protein EYF80_002902 [Liparis tanakae]|uniref:Uncharacterized protein n=1 Tax=Liparis tanakae TaxID=230148 RepID=A0A4Z2J954_9TELE|nr:hypothetical protein EYF80_002902 [Liparis tanakae]
MSPRVQPTFFARILVYIVVANVFIEPAQGLDLVQQAIVPLSRLVPCAQEPCRSNIRIKQKDSQNIRMWLINHIAPEKGKDIISLCSAVNGMKLQYVMSMVACLLDKVSDTALVQPPLHPGSSSQHMQSCPSALHLFYCAPSIHSPPCLHCPAS